MSVFWYAQREPGAARPLSGDVRADVVVVGGGVAGLSCARRLFKKGISTVVVERGFCGSGASGKSSGFITPASELELRSLISSHGPETAKRVWDFGLSGVEAIRADVREHDIQCDYQVQDSLFAANSASGWLSVQKEHRARLQLGYQSQLYGKNEVTSALCTAGYEGAVRYSGTFAIDSYSYCQGLSGILKRDGMGVFENSPVSKIRENGVDTPSGSVHARHVVVCADRFIPELGFAQQEIYHAQTFLGISRPLSTTDVRRVFAGDRLMTWDSDLVYSYFRLAGDDRILLGGGDLVYTYAHSPPKKMDRFAERLKEYFHAKFPDVPLELENVWSGMLGVSKDLLPVMGRDAARETVWYAGAATGLPWAAALGIYAADRIIRGRNDFDEMFSPRRRFTLGPRVQSLLSTPVTYAISHGMVKYSRG